MPVTKKDVWQTLAGVGSMALLAIIFIVIYPYSHVLAWAIFLLVFVALVELAYAPLRALLAFLKRKLSGK